jgi:hypothetical protein
MGGGAEASCCRGCGNQLLPGFYQPLEKYYQWCAIKVAGGAAICYQSLETYNQPLEAQLWKNRDRQPANT